MTFATASAIFWMNAAMIGVEVASVEVLRLTRLFTKALVEAIDSVVEASVALSDDNDSVVDAKIAVVEARDAVVEAEPASSAPTRDVRMFTLAVRTEVSTPVEPEAPVAIVVVDVEESVEIAVPEDEPPVAPAVPFVPAKIFVVEATASSLPIMA